MAPTHVLRCCQRGLAWIPVIFIALVVCWSYYAYVVELCLFTIPSPIEKAIYLAVFHVSFIMFVWSYWKTIFTRPATPSKEFCLPKSEKEQYEKEQRPETQQEILKRVATSLPLYTRTGAGAIRYCDRCQVIKPDRCHHCSACDMVNNCVGFSNYKFFILFLTYSLVYCLFIAASVLQYFIKFWTSVSVCTKLCRRKSAENCPKSDLPESHAKFHVLFLFFVAAMFCISILSLFTYHLWLVGKNRSTIGDGFSFPTRLVTVDPEQPTECIQPAALDKGAVEGSAEQTTPLSESQNRLLGNDYHTEEDHKETDALKSGRLHILLHSSNE
ncbi:Palmitoyltransferase ZDHHC20-B [Labeo rohita]|uniref:Palmitoyltransferase n=1 Tax=Labeo rohita TaxID=84645 RepID=A0ABQ8LH10_LABRO|nr:Palmitoyltransferase ZDHHC20-B [Labeo rohita]